MDTRFSKIECQIPDALGNTAFKASHTEVCAPKIITLPIRCLPSLLQKSDDKAIYESPPKGVQICLVRETLRFLPHNGCSQEKKRCRIPNAVWDGACQLVAR